VASELAVVVQSASGGWSETIPNFDLAAFDENTMFCFHFYIPGEFTHQGINYPDFYGVPFPITRYPGGKRRMLTDIFARLASDAQLGAAEKQKLEANYRGVIDYLWDGESPLDRSWVKWPKLDKWIAANRVDPARLLCGEFGVDGTYNFNGAPGADLLSRANYMRAVRENVESRGFGGWIAHQAMGDFNIFEQSSVNRHGDTLIPELVQALFH
jgi:hypothetical protein